jgi:hypothetical protein
MLHSVELRLHAVLHAESLMYICEFATISKNGLTRYSLAQVGLIGEKTEGRKSRPFKMLGYRRWFQ